MTRMYLANARHQVTQLNFKFHVHSYDIAIWYQDFFNFKGMGSDGPEKVIDQEKQLFTDAFPLIAPAGTFYEEMKKDIVGPAMLIIGILLGTIGVGVLIYYIRKMRKSQDQEMFGLESSSFEKNNMMVKYYTQGNEAESPTKFMARNLTESALLAEQERKEEQHEPLIDPKQIDTK